jgi:hypothetical protein
MARGYKAPSNYEPRKKKGAGKFNNKRYRPEPSARPAPTPPEKSEPKREAPERRAPRIPTDEVYAPLPATTITAAEAEGVSFADLGLGPRIIRELAKQGAETPYPLQVATIPDALAGRNVLGRGRTGSGKTIAFGAALVERLFLLRGKRGRVEGRAPQALVLAPTRELALQIDRTIQPFARAIGFFTTQLYGGVPAARQHQRPRRPRHPRPQPGGHHGARRGRHHERHGLHRAGEQHPVPHPPVGPADALLGHARQPGSRPGRALPA